MGGSARYTNQLNDITKEGRGRELRAITSVSFISYNLDPLTY